MRGKGTIVRSAGRGYNAVLADVVRLIETGRTAASRSVNAAMTATYWGLGRRIVEHEQGGRRRAEYGAALIERLADDLTSKCGRGFGKRNLFQMRAFYLAYSEIGQTPSAQLAPGAQPERVQIVSAMSALEARELPRFPLPWSHYVRLLAVANPTARHFYEDEALRGGWTIKQLDRQIGSQSGNSANTPLDHFFVRDTAGSSSSM